MKNIHEITAKDIMSSNIKSIDKKETLNTAVAILNKERIHNIIVYNDKKYTGIFGYKQLVKLHRRPPDDTKIGDFTFKPPLITPDTNIIDIVELMYRLNYKILPIGSEKEIAGVVSEQDILNAILNFNLLSNKKVRDFMTPDPLILNENDSIGKAMKLFRENNVSRIPIINNNNTLSGLLESLDLIREITTKEQYIRDSGTSSTLTSIRPSSYITEIISNHKIPVKSVMTTNIVTSKTEDILIEKIKENIRLGTSTIITTDENNHPLGITAPKDIIQFLAAIKEKEKLYIQISGLESIQMLDDFQKSEIHDMIDRTIRKISNISKPLNFTIHAKAYHTEGNRTKYTFRCKFSTNNGIIFAKKMGWDPIDTVSTLMGEIEKISIKKAKKYKDNIISKNRDTKYSI